MSRDASMPQPAGLAGQTTSRPPVRLPYGLVLPALGLLSVVLLLPSLAALVISLQNRSFGTEATFVGLANYAQVLADPGFWNAVRNTVLFVVLSVGGELLLGLGAALLLARGFRFQSLWISLMLAPYAVSPVVAVVMWKYMIEPDVGLINYLLAQVGIHNPPWTFSPNLSFLLIVLIQIWTQMPFSFIILYAAMMSVPTELYEAATVDGASGFQTFWNITLPSIVPAMMVALVFRVIFAIRAFDHIWVFNQGGPFGATEVLAIYLQNWGFRYWQFGLAATTAVLMLLLTAAIASFYVLRMSRELFGRRAA